MTSPPIDCADGGSDDRVGAGWRDVLLDRRWIKGALKRFLRLFSTLRLDDLGTWVLTFRTTKMIDFFKLERGDGGYISTIEIA